MRSGRTLVLGVALAACACSSTTTATTTSAETTAPPTTTAVWPSGGGGREDPPLLVVTSGCGMCPWISPPGFAPFLVYGDGTAVTADLTMRSGEPRTVSLRQYHLASAALNSLYAAAEAARLMEGGDAAVGDANWCADCGAVAFTSRLGGRLTRVSTPCLCTDSAEIEGGTKPQRDALRRLLDLLDDLTLESQGDPLRPTAYVLFLSNPTDEAADLEADGVDLAGFTETEYGELCGLVPAGNPIGADIIAFPSISVRVRFGDEVRLAHARPAYPHEHTCADIDR